MVNRIKISSTEFKVSNPGFDVATATADNLAFDAFNYRYSGAYIIGNSKSNDGTWLTASLTFAAGTFNQGVILVTRIYKTIPFAKTFSSPPQVLYALRQISVPANGATPRYSHVVSSTNNWTGAVAGASASTTALTLRIDYPTSGNGGGITDWEFAYIVFQS